MPYDLKGQIKLELLELAEKVCIGSAKIASGYNKHVVNAFRDVLRITNSYYSNRIEAESTHPIDIEKAMLKQFSEDSKQKVLQELSVAHIQTQKFVENYASEHNVIDRNFIKEIHRLFYSSEGMGKFTKLEKENELIEMIPGEFRNRDVQVGNHIAPSNDLITTVICQPCIILRIQHLHWDTRWNSVYLQVFFNDVYCFKSKKRKTSFICFIA